LPPDGFREGAIVVSCGRLNIAITLGGRLVNPDRLESSLGDAQDVRIVLVSTVGIGSRRRGIRAKGREAPGEHLLDGFSISEIFQRPVAFPQKPVRTRNQRVNLPASDIASLSVVNQLA
jgi:hypothetical protein